jgi:hypothetical protein
MGQKTKQIITVFIILIVAFVGYKMFFVNPQPADSTLTVDSSSYMPFTDGQEVLATLNELEGVNLDGSIFTNKVFLNLTSFERQLEPQTPNRKNPFLPIGMEGSVSVPTLSTSTVVNRR